MFLEARNSLLMGWFSPFLRSLVFVDLPTLLQC